MAEEKKQHPLSTMERLAQLEVKRGDHIPKHEFLYRWHDTPCFARGELVAVGGKAKSGKTYLCSMLMTLACEPVVLCLSRETETPYSVLWIDTEQSEDTTHEILTDRISAAADVTVYNLRSAPWQERMELVISAIAMRPYDLVIFDGIRDVVGDINDYQVAQTVVDKLLSLASWSKACIVCVLHQNKMAEDKTLRGAIGTELMNKCYEVYECRKEERVLVVQQQASRKYCIDEKLYYRVDEQNRPVRSDSPAVREHRPSASASATIDSKFLNEKGKIDKHKLMQFALAENEHLRFEQLRLIVMKISGIQRYGTVSDLIHEAVSEGVLRTTVFNGVEFYSMQS